jgi:two-component system, LytTR family, sensor kinase
MEQPFSVFGIKTTNIRLHWWLVILAHILFWCGFVFVPLLLMQPNGEPFRSPDNVPRITPEQREAVFYATFFFNNILSVLLFYLNSEWIVPRLFRREKIHYYFLIAISLLVLGILFNFYFRYWLLGHEPRTFFSFGTFYLFLSVLGISACYRFVSDFQREQRLRTEREKVRLQSELSFLRSQISPHFMFNLMNSLQSLARKKSDLLEPMIIKMSDLLRYMLYDSDDAKILIDKEINYLTNYIDLQKMRFGSHVKIETNFEIQNNQLSLEPMLLIPFVENAFKHGTGYISEPIIEVVLRTNADSLTFGVKNRFNDEFKESKDDSSGIGLANVRRRLQLLYPEKHILQINQSENLFSAELSIKI